MRTTAKRWELARNEGGLERRVLTYKLFPNSLRSSQLCFYFEHIPAKSLSRLVFESRMDMPTFKMDEFSPLYRHWAREVLISLSQLQEQCPYVLLNAFDINAANCMAARQGTSIRLGRLLWGPLYDPSAGSGPTSSPKAFFRQRECALLRGFGRILRSMLSSEKEEEVSCEWSTVCEFIPNTSRFLQSLKRFVPNDAVTVDVGALVKEEVRHSEGRRNSAPHHLPLKLTLFFQSHLSPRNSLRAQTLQLSSRLCLRRRCKSDRG